MDLLRCVYLRSVVKPSKSTFQRYDNISDEWMWSNHFNKTLIFSKQFKFVWFSLSSIKCSWSLLSEVQRGKIFKNSIWQTGTLKNYEMKIQYTSVPNRSTVNPKFFLKIQFDKLEHCNSKTMKRKFNTHLYPIDQQWIALRLSFNISSRR